MTKEELKQLIEEKENQRTNLGREISALRQQYVDMTCPIKIGQEVTSQNGRKHAIVSRITPSYGDLYRLWGHRILKDGRQSEVERELWWV